MPPRAVVIVIEGASWVWLSVIVVLVAVRVGGVKVLLLLVLIVSCGGGVQGQVVAGGVSDDCRGDDAGGVEPVEGRWWFSCSWIHR